MLLPKLKSPERSKLQSLLHAMWPPLRRSPPPPLVVLSSPTSLPPVVSGPALLPPPAVAVPITLSRTASSSPAASLVLYDRSKCNTDCPLCEKKFTNDKDSRKTLVKHMKEKHRFCDAGNSRLMEWMTASNRFWCASCGLSFSNRLSHTCLPSAFQFTLCLCQLL